MNNLLDYINLDLKPLQATETIDVAQDLFLEVHYSHFPVMEEGIYIGSINKEEAETLSQNLIIGDQRYNFERFFVRSQMIWLDVLEEFSKNDCNIMPVLDENNNYIGYYELEDVVQFFQASPFLKEEGAILIVQKKKLDYSMSEVCQIIEGNNGKLLGVFISNFDDEFVEITLKITHIAINEIIQSFRRYNYEIVTESKEDSYLENLKERSEYLDKYLNI